MATFTIGQRVGIVRGVQTRRPAVYMYGTVTRTVTPWGVTEYVVTLGDGGELVYPAHLLRDATPTARELAAITAIFRAYMALASFPDDHSLSWERTPGISDPPSALGYLAEAGRTAWEAIGCPRIYWSEMITSGESAEYIYRELHSEEAISQS
jgi:hypothetical protein